jgi:adenylosuccinate synthase
MKPMDRPRFASVLGLGFGDCGKGLFVDALCRYWAADTVMRFNGGAQAGHNVITPDGRHHTFSQFGAGSFVPGTRSLLGFPVVVHPSALLVENHFLQRMGVQDGLARLSIDARCRINTPFHQAAGRLREMLRGELAHGSCGVGVGETVRHALAFPAHVLYYGDLGEPARALSKLEQIRLDLRADLESAAAGCLSPAAQSEWRMLNDAALAQAWLAQIAALLRQVPPSSPQQMAAHMRRASTLVFEGAQGILLDEWRGFHPYTTWSTTHGAAVEAVMRDADLPVEELRHFGALRSYLTRHGNGPLPTHDLMLDALAEPHNSSSGWQGAFRRGQPDALLLRYALACVGRLDGLLLSHLDVFQNGRSLKWASAYDAPPGPHDPLICRRDAEGRVSALLPSRHEDLAHQQALTQLLMSARPCFEHEPVATVTDCIERIEAIAGCRVAFGAAGPSAAQVQAF